MNGLKQKSRYCTMPKIPFFRDWYENKFGDLCYLHDLDYYNGMDKIEADYIFCQQIAQRGYKWLAILTLIAINMPWVSKS